MNFKVFSVLLLFSLAACAQIPTKVETENAAELSEQSETSPSNLPRQVLTTEILFDFLLGEAALQRGHPEVAVGKYLHLAELTKDPRIAQRATEIALNSQHMAAAAKAVSIWTASAPDSVPANQAAAAMLVNAGRLKEAQPYLEKLLATEKDELGRAFIQLSKLLSRNSNKAAVLRLMQQLSQPYPDLPEAHFAIAQAAWFANQHQLARDEMDLVLELRPDWEMAAVYQGQILQQLSYGEHIDFYEDYLNEFPGSNEVRASFVRVLIVEGDAEKAREQLQLLLIKNPANAEIAVTVGLMSMELRDFDVTEASFNKALGLGFKDPSLIHFHLGRIYEETEQTDKAMAAYYQVTTGGRFVPAQIRYATILSQRGRLNDARQHLHKLSVENDQQAMHLILAEAHLLRRSGAHQEVFNVLDSGLEKQPESPELLYDHALAAEKLGKFEILERDLRKLIQLRPDSAHAYNALGYSLAERGERLPEALKLIKKAVELSPDDAYIMDSLGWVHYRMGNVKAGLNYLNLAFATKPDPEIAAHLGEVLWEQGAKEDAQKIWQSAIKDNPDNDLLLDTIQRFLK